MSAFFFARHPKLREDAIKFYGPQCCACGFDFEAVYGALGKGYIEIHHLEAMSTKAKSKAGPWTISVTDVRPLCANLTLFEDTLPPWMMTGPKVNWSHSSLGLESAFVALRKLTRWTGDGGPVGILDGLQVARKLARDPDVLATLRAASK